jgi:phosphoribosylformylglycinamidine (FGAM) synthase PurS component
MCQRLLANTILEEYALEVDAGERLAPPGAVR